MPGGLLPWLRDFQNSQINTHILATGQPEQDITSAIEEWARSQEMIPIHSSLIDEDIRAYVYTRVGCHKGLNRWQRHPDVQTEIEAALTKKGRWNVRYSRLDDMNKLLKSL